MSEMLGNYYFQKRDYRSAILQFEKAINPLYSNAVKKKLIICYAHQKYVVKTFELFAEVVTTNINIIVNTNYDEEMCPCPDLIYEYENHSDCSAESFEDLLILGILWLYCDIYKSFDYLNRAVLIKSENKKLSHVLKIISDEIIHLEKKQKPQ